MPLLSPAATISLEKKTMHDKALEAYQAAMAKYTRDRTKLLDWIPTNREIKEQAKQNFTNTDCTFKLYNQAHPDRQITHPKEPQFSEFYILSALQKQGELLFVGGSERSAIWLFVLFELFAVLHISSSNLLEEQGWTPSSPKSTTAPGSTGKALLPTKN